MAAKIKGEVARCAVSEIRNGVRYQCTKSDGHEFRRGDEEHEATAAEYVTLDWQAMFEVSRSILEWAAANPNLVGQDRNELARRLLIRAYTAWSSRPRLVKAKIQ